MKTPVSPIPPRRSGRFARPAPALFAVAAGGVLMVAASLLLARGAGAGGLSALFQASLVYGLAAAGILIGAGRGAVSDRFGPANWITLGRTTLVCALAGVVGAGLDGGAGWLLASVGLFAFALDGLDGWVARRTGTSSEFGARFDREIDSLFGLVLALLVADLREIGPWVLLIGLLRYAFVAGRAIWPWLATALPPSRRRKAIFFAQVTLLLACMPPVVGPALATTLAAAALFAVGLSFAIDIRWLHRHAASGPSRCKGPRADP